MNTSVTRLLRALAGICFLLEAVCGRCAETSGSSLQPNPILQQEQKQQQIRSTTQRVGEQLAAILAEFDRNGISGEDVKVLRAIRGVLGKLTEKDMENSLGNRIRKGDRLLLRTDHNNTYDGGSEKWMKDSPYLTIGATMWCIEKGVVIVGYDFYHGNDEPDSPRVFHNSRTLSEHGIITMPYLKNLDRIEKDRFTLIGLPLKMIGAEASPIRAVAVY